MKGRMRSESINPSGVNGSNRDEIEEVDVPPIPPKRTQSARYTRPSGKKHYNYDEARLIPFSKGNLRNNGQRRPNHLPRHHSLDDEKENDLNVQRKNLLNCISLNGISSMLQKQRYIYFDET